MFANNISTWANAKSDSSCIITFFFDSTGVMVIENAKDLWQACDFGPGIDATGYYWKTSTNWPEFIDPATGGKLKK